MSATTTAEELVPGEALSVDRMPGHWLLARLGKRVLRPGGRELTDRLLGSLDINSSDHVVELAPGLGSTTELVLERNPLSYVGVDRDPVSAERVAHVVAGENRSVRQASAADTGLETDSADVVFGEAYLTMQPSGHKERILAELARVVRPGGRLGLHEIALTPDDLGEDETRSIESALRTSIKVHVSPLSVTGWIALLDRAGFDVEQRFTAPLHLLEPRRLIADEGPLGAARFVGRTLRNGEARRRVTAMRAAMHNNARHLQACVLTARLRSDGPDVQTSST